MTILAVLQARTTSSRLPGKVLLPLAGRPMILRQLERIERAQTIDMVVVATSSDASDDELCEVLVAAGYCVVRGSLEDVLGRFIAVIDRFEPDVVVRLTADCPLLSPSVVDEVVRAFLSDDADYVSNTMTPTFPDGIDVEVVRARVLREVAEIAADPPEREHVTLGVYRRHEQYRIANVTNVRNGIAQDHSHLRWTVDTPEDFAFVEGVYRALFETKPAFEYEDVLGYLERNPKATRTSADSVRNAALIGLDTGAMSNPS